MIEIKDRAYDMLTKVLEEVAGKSVRIKYLGYG